MVKHPIVLTAAIRVRVRLSNGCCLSLRVPVKHLNVAHLKAPDPEVNAAFFSRVILSVCLEEMIQDKQGTLSAAAPREKPDLRV